MKLFALLTIPIAALAAPQTTISKRFSPVPFAPATPEQGAFHKCSSAVYHKGNSAHAASMLDCLDIGKWAREHNGMWILDADDNDWHLLRAHGTCALVAKITQPTSVGNKDVGDFIEDVHLGDGVRLGPVEEVGTFCGCQAGANVSFWLRSSKS